MEEVGGSSGCWQQSSLCPGAQVCCRLWALPTLCFGSGASVLGTFWEYSLLSLITEHLIEPAHFCSAFLFSAVISGCPEPWNQFCGAYPHLTLWKNIENKSTSGEGRETQTQLNQKIHPFMQRMQLKGMQIPGSFACFECSWLLMADPPWILAEDVTEEKALTTKGCCRMPSNGPA